MEAAKKPSRLGKGLNALMGTAVSAPAPVEPVAPVPGSAEPVPRAIAPPGVVVRELAVDAIGTNPHQPRQSLDERTLAELTASIRTHGVLQPILVREAEDGRFELIAGERRWRSARLAGLSTVPAIVREADEADTAEWALIENLQREDLNPVDRADAFQHLATRFGMTHAEVADRVGLDRATVSNHLRLRALPDTVRGWLAAGRLSMGQARALLAIDDPNACEELAGRVLRDQLSVRQTEALVKARAQVARAGKVPPPAARPAHDADLERQISTSLGLRTNIRRGRRKGSGTITIAFDSLEGFDALMDRLGVRLE